MTESPARVGIVVRTKDRPVLLERALRDIAAQRYRLWRVIVVNDGGDRGPVDAVLAALSPADLARTTIVHHLESKGRSAAANVGILALDTEFVVLHDDDDRWHPDFLSETTAWLESHPVDVGVATRTEIVYERETSAGLVETGRVPFWPDLHRISYAELLQVNRFVPIAYLYRRAVHTEVGLYREDVHAAEDWEFNLRVAARHTIGFLGDSVLAYWMQRPSATGPLGNSMFELADDHEHFDRLIRDEALRAFVAAHGDGLPLYLARLVQDEVGRQLDARRTIGQRIVTVGQRWRRRRHLR